MMKRDENGVYHWNGTVDVPYEHKTFKIVFGVCGGICLFFLLDIHISSCPKLHKWFHP